MKMMIENAMPVEYNNVLLSIDPKRPFTTPTEFMNDALKIPVHAISTYLAMKKSREDVNGTSLIVRDASGNFIIAGIVKYHAPEQMDQAGNWSYEFTFNEEDVKETHQYVINDTTFTAIAMKVSHNHSLVIKDETYVFNLVLAFFIALKNVLSDNIVLHPEEEVEIESDGYFIATCAIEDGEKVYSLVPSGDMKKIIKDDSTLEMN